MKEAESKTEKNWRKDLCKREKVRKVSGYRRRRTLWTWQSGRVLFNTIPETPDDGNIHMRR